jgi:N-acetylneuraminate synthase/N,N'-diacetyllegionaminate synthase
MPPLALSFHHASADHGPTVLIVAELGVNHDGDSAQAETLIDAAANAGADAIKLQYFRADRLISADARLARYQTETSDDPYTLLKARELSLATMEQLKIRAHRHGLGFIVTPFSLADVDELGELGIDAIKIASPDAINKPLLQKASVLAGPMLISTGTCDVDALHTAAGVLRAHAAGGALLQCVSCYPTPSDQAALAGIGALREAFALPVGYSDHTASEHAGAWAIAAGACVLEKHLTLDRTATGPDHAASLDPAMFARYVEQARAAGQALGPTRKTPLVIEADVSDVARQSVCTTRHLPADHVIKRDDLTLKRPGTGIPAGELDQLINRTTRRPIEADRVLRWADLY